jgi:nitroimidazol reductase NimA-like FMN-containing flavoprotein (pyridoxamine 5'-phosphate oxidase superfamily)
MRRHEREVTEPEAIVAIIHDATICRVGFVDHGEPYVVPLNVGHEAVDGSPGGRFWFHSATAGRKSRLIATEPRVCVQLEQDLGLITHPDRACAWTQGYRSLMAWGTARAARDRREARHGLDVLMRHHGGSGGWTYPDRVLEQTLVWCVEVDRITAKQHHAKTEDG